MVVTQPFFTIAKIRRFKRENSRMKFKAGKLRRKSFSINLINWENFKITVFLGFYYSKNSKAKMLDLFQSKTIRSIRKSWNLVLDFSNEPRPDFTGNLFKGALNIFFKFENVSITLSRVMSF